MAELLAFPGAASAEASIAGGKGAALLSLAAAGLPVPEGRVLVTDFFAPWFETIRATEAWARLRDSEVADWADGCRPVQDAAEALPLSDPQRATLDALRTAVGDWGLVAVRSSSPEEDMASASFAGGYTTVLGVRPEALEDAVRACFVSALDVRVLRYKQEHGFDPFAPRIAVVVQRQLDSQVAGVGFSLNPVNNDHDEAVFDACWGLGEAVVSGRTSPDRVVVRRLDGAIAERHTGGKEHSVWLRPDGGTEARTGYRSDEPCLTDARVAELTALIDQVERWLDRPVDIEWAYADGVLHLLQARPITGYLPLPPELMTVPGERRWLYMDASLSNGLTLNVPVSPLGLDWLFEIFTQLLERFMGPLPRTAPEKDALYMATGGRLYANLSYLLWLQTPAMLERSQRQMDALMAATMGAIDARRYRSRRLPPFVHPAVLLRLPRLLWSAAPLAARLVATLLAPARMFPRYLRDVDALEAKLREPLPDAPFAEVMQQGFDDVMRIGFDAIWSALGAYGVGLMLTEVLAPAVDRRLAMRLEQGFEGNVVVEMGVALLEMAGRLDPEAFDDLDDLANRVVERDLPAPFLDAWDDFQRRYGHRGPVEMDLARPRYRDDPHLALEQLASMRGARHDLAASHAERVAERARAFEALMAKASWWRRAPLRWADRLLALFAGTRDTPKYLLTLYNDRLRRRALDIGRSLVAAGRLDDPAQVFDLHLDELAVAGDPDVDLRARLARNTAFLDRLRGRSLTFPPVIDSRGRILRPAKGDETPGELRGMGVSPGIAAGRVRVLHHPAGQVVAPGEVLVAYTTDPGWTPLFVNAAALVLEIGGTLQHGALVAREYGKPCVVGVARVTERLRDGMVVEVDGFEGTVRVVREDAPGTASTAGAGQRQKGGGMDQERP